MARSLKMGKEMLKEVNDSQSMRLTVPEDAVQKGAGDGASYRWSELFVVTDATITEDQKNKSRDVYKVTFTVPKDSPYPTNVGRSATYWYRVNPDAVGDSGHPDRVMTRISLSRLLGIIAAAGQPVDESTDPSQFFDGKGPASPALVFGARIVATMNDKPDKDQDDQPTRKQEPVKFLSVADAGIE